MFMQVSKKLTDILVENQIVDSESRELYQFGIEQTFTIILNLITTLVIGLLFGMVWQILLFMAAYIPLRSFCGGVHAKTPLRCYFSSVILLTAIEAIIKYASLNMTEFVIIYWIASIIIIFLSPVEDLNKPLDEVEKTVYKRKAVLLWVIESTLLWIFFSHNLQVPALCMLLVIVVLAVMLVLGLLKNYLLHKT